MRDNMYAEAWAQLTDILLNMSCNPRYLDVERYLAERVLSIMDTLIPRN